ncbi:MAG: DUF488 domain-containing protein [Candidatus Nanohaloarchaea archaeon]|nr:DUF488 domain-containing protein [Candidatus Nanohaloarchaea archaeon]
MTFYTVGHSTRSRDELHSLLEKFNIDLLVDVRSIPRSGHNPQFNKEKLKDGIRDIEYRHMEELGGYRNPEIEYSPNTSWENDSFQNYADYALTDEFDEALQDLLDLAEKRTIAIMCAEKVWWRCHRRIIADYLVVNDKDVVHIIEENRTSEHSLTEFAVCKNGVIHYSSEG